MPLEAASKKRPKKNIYEIFLFELIVWYRLVDSKWLLSFIWCRYRLLLLCIVFVSVVVVIVIARIVIDCCCCYLLNIVASCDDHILVDLWLPNIRINIVSASMTSTNWTVLFQSRVTDGRKRKLWKIEMKTALPNTHSLLLSLSLLINGFVYRALTPNLINTHSINRILYAILYA